MDYNEFANKVKEKYPDYADMSNEDLARAMMKKFPEYSDIDTSGISSPKSQGYAYSSPEEYQDLYNNAKNVGYSGLDENQKKLFDAAYSQSLYAKQGRSLEEAHQATDRAAGINPANQNAGDAWTLARMALSLPVAAVGGYIRGMDKYKVDPNTGLAVETMPGSTYLERVNQAQNDILEEAKNNQGIPGLLSNPTNVVAGEVRAPIALGEKVIPSIAKGLGYGAAQGAGLSAADQYMNNGNIEPGKVALSAGLGGVVGSVARPLERKATQYDKWRLEKKLAEEDPWEHIARSNKLADAYSSIDKEMNEIDPKGLYATYQEFGKSPAFTNDILKEAKKDIAERSNLPRKMSTITDREAREHLDNIIRQIEEADNRFSTNMPDITPQKPEGLFQGLGRGLSREALPMFGGGAIGHYVGGIPGAIGGALIASPTARGVVDKLIEKGARTPLVQGVGTYAPAAGMEYLNQHK